MDVLETLSVALGLATLAGINLYLTVLVTGMAIQFGWVVLPPHLHDLVVLGDPWVIAISGVFYLLEFFADKIPWIDTANDAVHTFVRPLGGALLAVLALGEANPAVQVIAGLLAGGAALTAHAAKAGARLMANVSPEPFSNIGLSLGEDALVLGGLGLLLWNPLVACVLTILALGVIWTMFPRLLRRMRSTGWLAWRKLNGPSAGLEATALQSELPVSCFDAVRRRRSTNEPVAFAARCISDGGPGLPKGYFGWLTRLGDGSLFFVAPRRRDPLVVEVPLPGASIQRESRFLCERLRVRPTSGRGFDFAFERGHCRLADEIARELTEPARKELEVAAAI
ncbi:MAG TPA: DUF4126 domain-containing protein [Terrimicrobiaceae bacterium]